jgi:hypothetical protein
MYFVKPDVFFADSLASLPIEQNLVGLDSLLACLLLEAISIPTQTLFTTPQSGISYLGVGTEVLWESPYFLADFLKPFQWC